MSIEEIAFLIVMTVIIAGALLQDREECNNEKIGIKKALVTSAVVFIVMAVAWVSLNVAMKLLLNVACRLQSC